MEDETMISTSYEAPRGCGYRKPGGTYLVCNGMGRFCGRLPAMLTHCAACGSGIKPGRGWRWFDPREVVETFLGEDCGLGECGSCPLGGGLADIGRAGLLWIGGNHYPEPGDFLREAGVMGVSRRVGRTQDGQPTLPRGLEIGKTWVFLAHRKAVAIPCGRCERLPAAKGLFGVSHIGAPGKVWSNAEQTWETCPDCDGSGERYAPGIFHAFKPNRVEHIVTGQETEEQLARLEERGFTLVRVVEVEAEDERAGIRVNRAHSPGQPESAQLPEVV